MFELLMLVVVVLIAQAALSLMQMKNYKAAADRLRQKGRIGVGTKKGSFGSGSIIILASDPNKVIIAGEKMQGTSVFAKFQDYDEWNGYTLRKASTEIGKRLETSKGGAETKRLTAAYGAVQMLLASYDKKNYDKYVDRNAQEKEEFFEEIDLADEKIVDAVITEENVGEEDGMQDVFEEHQDFDEFAAPEIIDVEEIKEDKI